MNTSRKFLFMFSVMAGIMAASIAHSEPALTSSGEENTLYSWSKDKCANSFIPDSPARAFRRADGKMTLISTHLDNWSMVGSSIRDLKPSCKPLLSKDVYTKKGFGSLWIEATYTANGKDVTALLSEDFTEKQRARGCDPGGVPGRCWLNDIISAHSSDMGETFQLAQSPDEKVISISGDYPPDAKRRVGAFTTTNIVQDGDQFYMIVWLQGVDDKNSGNCLFRTRSPSDPSSWRAWDGKNFSLDLRSPGAANCHYIQRSQLPTEARSISRLSKYGLWVSVFSGRLKMAGDAAPVTGFYAAFSRDLLNWQSPTRIMAAPTVAREQQNDFVLSYPSLLDPNSKSRNFDTIDHDDAVLFYTKHHLKDGRGTMNRDLNYSIIDIK